MDLAHHLVPYFAVASGVVYFDTCFPGWYSSRTIHVHMTISVGGSAYVTTQFGFDDTLDDSIVASQRWADLERNGQVAVMVDARDALDVGPLSDGVEFTGYVDSWGAKP